MRKINSLLVLLSLYAIVPFIEARWFADLVGTAVTVFAVASVSEKRGFLAIFSLLASEVLLNSVNINNRKRNGFK